MPTANFSMNRAMTATSPGSGPVFTSPSGVTDARTLSWDWIRRQMCHVGRRAVRKMSGHEQLLFGVVGQDPLARFDADSFQNGGAGGVAGQALRDPLAEQFRKLHRRMRSAGRRRAALRPRASAATSSLPAPREHSPTAALMGNRVIIEVVVEAKQ